MAKVKTPKRKVIRKVYQVTALPGTNCRFISVTVLGNNKKEAIEKVANSEKILNSDLKAKRFKSRFPYVLGINLKQNPQ